MAEGPRKVNWFAIWVSIGVVVALVAVAIFVVTLNNQAVDPEPGQAPSAANIDADTGAILFGDGSNTVETYIDFMCPYCAEFERTEGDTLSRLVDDGEVTLSVFPVVILDHLSQGTEYSSRAASSMYAVAEADPDNAYAYMQALFVAQPQEQTPGLTNEQLVEVAESAGVQMTADLEAAILSGKYIDFAQETLLPDGARGTPTLIVNGVDVPVTFDPEVDILSHLN